MTGIDEIEDRPALERYLADQGDSPVWIFKHSLTCGTSGWALDRYRRFVEEQPTGHGCRFAILPVQTARDASDHLAALTGVRHESPQALLLQGNRVLWHASHWRITEKELAAAALLAAPEAD